MDTIQNTNDIKKIKEVLLKLEKVLGCGSITNISTYFIQSDNVIQDNTNNSGNNETIGNFIIKDELNNIVIKLNPGSETEEPSITILNGERYKKIGINSTVFYDGDIEYNLIQDHRGLHSIKDFSLVDSNNLKVFAQRNFVINNRAEPDIYQVVATANQLTFILPKIPIGKVLFIINNTPAKIDSISINNNNITYNPTRNNNYIITNTDIITIYYSALKGNDSSTLWYLADGITNQQILGVYNAIGASSLAESMKNIINPSINNLTVFNNLYSPEWSPITGWKFKVTYADGNFNPHAFSTNFALPSKNCTVIFSFNDPMTEYSAYFGCFNNNYPQNRFDLQYDSNSNKITAGNGVPDDAFLPNANVLANTNTVLAINNNGIYKDGVLIRNVDTLSSNAVPNFENFLIGTIGWTANGAVNWYGTYKGYIHCMAIYEGDLTLSQINKISNDMKLLVGIPTPLYQGESIFNTTLYSTTNPID